MQYRRLGRAGVCVPTVGLGSWLTYGGSVEDDTARVYRTRLRADRAHGAQAA